MKHTPQKLPREQDAMPRVWPRDFILPSSGPDQPGKVETASMPSGFRSGSRGDELEMHTPCPIDTENTSSSSSRESSPSPQKLGGSRFNVDESEIRLPDALDTAPKKKRKKKKKPKKHKQRSKPPEPGFELLKNPGDAKSTVIGFMQSRPELDACTLVLPTTDVGCLLNRC